MYAYLPLTLLLCCLHGYASLDTFTPKLAGVAVNATLEENEEPVNDNTQLEKETKDWRKQSPERVTIPDPAGRSITAAPQMSLERRKAYNSIRDREAYFKKREEVRSRQPSRRRVQDTEKDVLETQETVHRTHTIIPNKPSVISNFYEFGAKIPKKISTKLSLIDGWGTTALPGDMDNLVMPLEPRFAAKSSRLVNNLSTNLPVLADVFHPSPLPLTALDGKYPKIEYNKNNHRLLLEMNGPNNLLTSTTNAPTIVTTMETAAFTQDPVTLPNSINLLKTPSSNNSELLPQTTNSPTVASILNGLSNTSHIALFTLMPISSSSPFINVTEPTHMTTTTEPSVATSNYSGEVRATTESTISNHGSTSIKEPEQDVKNNGITKLNDSSIVDTSNFSISYFAGNPTVFTNISSSFSPEATSPPASSKPAVNSTIDTSLTPQLNIVASQNEGRSFVNESPFLGRNEETYTTDEETAVDIELNKTTTTPINHINATELQNDATEPPEAIDSSRPFPDSAATSNSSKRRDLNEEDGTALPSATHMVAIPRYSGEDQERADDLDLATPLTHPTYIKVFVTTSPTEDTPLTIFYGEPGQSNLSEPGIFVTVVDDTSVSAQSVGIAVYLLAVFGLIPLVLASIFGAKFYLSRSSRKNDCESDASSTDARPPSQRRRGAELRKSPSTATTITLVHAPRLPRVPQQQPQKTSGWELPRHQLALLSILGHGNFGQVWKAELGDGMGNTPRLVAVKTVKEGATEKEQEELIKELHVMQQVGHHPNVVSLIGCCTEKDPYYLVMDYISKGKLLTYLREHRTQENYFNFSDDSNALTSRDLTLFMYCVARGMEYLASKRIIHRDLAARNVLVDQHKMCKIADFGMSRLVQEGGDGEVYEERQHRGALPIRWMSPESLHYSLFTHKSDVWSFGILMWEILTLGSTPYPSLGAREVVQGVRNGLRLQRPSHVKSELFRLVSRCWAQDPQTRPSFTELRLHLADLLDGSCVDLDSYALDNRFQLQTRSKNRRNWNTGKGTITLVGNGSFTVNSRILDNQFSIV